MVIEIGPPPVLVVEDDPHMRHALDGMLRHGGYPVVTVASANEALSYLAAGRVPCLILLDLTLPDIQGEAFYSTIRADAAFAGVPVVILTGRADPPRLPGVFATLFKGGPPEKLLGMIDAACRPQAAPSSN